MTMHKGALALAVTAALSTQAFLSSMSADAKSSAGLLKAGPIHGQPHFKYPNHATPAGATVLYDQSGTAENIVPVQDFQAAYDAYDSMAADDFVVTDAAGWTVSAFNFQVAFIDNGNPAQPPPSILYNVDVYADAGASPGAAVCSYAGVAGSLDPTATSLSVALPTACVLPQGTYWLSLTTVFDFPPQGFWSNASGAPIGNEGVFENPGGGFGVGCTSWSPISTCVGTSGAVGGANPNYRFQVVGAVGTGTCTPSGICLVSTVGTDMSPGACATTDTIDATVGDQLNFCYTVTNNTGIDLDFHTLENNVDGTLFRLTNQPVPAGASYQFNDIRTVAQTNTYNSTWTAQDVPPGYAAEVESGAGCPDRIFADGFDGVAVGCAGGNFVDITATGTALGLGDDEAVVVTMPFSFNFYGSTSNILSVGNNGGVFLGAPGASLGFDNVSLPAASLPGPAILPLWDDFDSESGDVYTDTRGVAPNRQFIVEWFDRVHYDGSSNTDGATFELILNEDGTLQFEYADVGYTALNNASADPNDCMGGICATIGLQGDPAVFNQYSAFAAAVTDDTGIKWTPTSPQVFTSSDSVTVNVGAPQIVVNPSPVSGTVTAGGTTTIPFSIENHGDRALNWSLTEAGPANLHFPPPGSRFAMPLGDPTLVSQARAPIARHTGTKPVQHSLHVPLNTVPAFAADIYQNNFETFDALIPAGINVVAATDGTPWTGGAFVGGDFSKLYVIAGNFASNPDQFATIDTATGSKTVIGTADSAGLGWNGMAYDATTGTLYATAGCGAGSTLFTIDINTGAATPVGSMPNEACTIAIAVNAEGEMYGVDIIADALFAIDKTNASDALIGSIGFNANYAQDMAFDQSTDILYLAGFSGDDFTDSVYTIDVGTGLATLIGPIGPNLEEVDAMGIETVGGPCAQPQDLPWLSLDPLTGTTPPTGASPINAGIDATTANAGDVLAGTVCATSNDPVNHVVATPITVDVTP